MGEAAPAASALLFTGGNQTGEVRAVGTAVSGRYDRYSYNDLVKEGLYRKFSSATLFAPGAGATALILFGDTHSMSLSSYQLKSRHLQLTNNSGDEWDVELGDFNFNNQTDQVLLVHTQRAQELRVSLAERVQEIWADLVGELPSEHVELDGDPRFGWSPFIQAQGLQDRIVYLHIEQDLTAITPWFLPNYAASISFTIRLRAQNGNAVRVGTWSHYRVEGGLITQVIEAILDPNLQLLTIQFNNAIDTVLAGVSSLGNVTDVYFLPGTQTALVNAGDTTSVMRDSVSDVTIVFEGVALP